MKLKGVLPAVILSLGLLPGAAVAAQNPQAFDEKAVANFYRGKTVRVIVGFSAGGGYDQYSRLIGRHLRSIFRGIRR